MKVSFKKEDLDSVAIFGFGNDGKSVFSFLKKIGVKKIAIFDEAERKIPKEAENFTGKRCQEKFLSDFQIIFRSPGVRPEKLSKAKKITSSSEFFLENFPGKTIGVTGSNGKTTTTELISKFFDKKGRRGGNDSKPLLDMLLATNCSQENTAKKSLQKNLNPSPTQIPILELSSFQLFDICYSPNYACLTNISKNHLDWHLNFLEYKNAKKNIIKFQKENDFAIINFQDKVSRNFVKNTKSNIFAIGERYKGSEAFLEKNTMQFFLNKKEIFSFPIVKIKIKTHPNNFLMAVSVALLNNIPSKKIIKVLTEFEGVPDRISFIRRLDQQNFYNDSSCTTPESAITAINNFKKGTQLILAGGRNKGMDFLELGQNAKLAESKIILYGEAREEIATDFKKAGFDDFSIYQRQENFDFLELVDLARKSERENIIFSPACASFDLFENAKERGRIFQEVILNLK